MPIAIPEKIEPMTPIKPLSAEKMAPVAEGKDQVIKPDGVKVDEMDQQGKRI